MNLHDSRNLKTDAEWRTRLAVLRNAPSPNLKRGRARVLAAAQRRLPATTLPQRVAFAFALGISVAVIAVMVVMGSAMGAWDGTSVAMTRTQIAQTVSPEVVPANALPRPQDARMDLTPLGTPVPNLVPEPPRSPVLISTATLLP